MRQYQPSIREGAFASDWRVFSSLAAELSLVAENLLFLLGFVVLVEVFVLFQQAVLLDLALGQLLVEQGFGPFAEIGQFDALLASKCLKGDLDFFLALLHPPFLLLLFPLQDLLLHFMRLRKSRYQNPYAFCLTMCCSIVLRFSKSELSLTLVESSASSSFLVSCSSCLCLASSSFSCRCPSSAISFILCAMWSL